LIRGLVDPDGDELRLLDAATLTLIRGAVVIAELDAARIDRRPTDPAFH
jgi:hypothetical protein